MEIQVLSDADIGYLKYRIDQLLEQLGLIGRITYVPHVKKGSIIYLTDLRTKDTHFHTYHLTSSGRKILVELGEYPMAVVPGLGFREPLCLSNYLEWCHWAKLDNGLNRLLDELEVKAKITSAFGVIRDGYDWDEIDVMHPVHEGEGIHEYLHTHEGVERVLREFRRKYIESGEAQAIVSAWLKETLKKEGFAFNESVRTGVIVLEDVSGRWRLRVKKASVVAEILRGSNVVRRVWQNARFIIYDGRGISGVPDYLRSVLEG